MKIYRNCFIALAIADR